MKRVLAILLLSFCMVATSFSPVPSEPTSESEFFAKATAKMIWIKAHNEDLRKKAIERAEARLSGEKVAVVSDWHDEWNSYWCWNHAQGYSICDDIWTVEDRYLDNPVPGHIDWEVSWYYHHPQGLPYHQYFAIGTYCILSHPNGPDRTGGPDSMPQQLESPPDHSE